LLPTSREHAPSGSGKSRPEAAAHDRQLHGEARLESLTIVDAFIDLGEFEFTR
jgi:hypothetical protein